MKIFQQERMLWLVKHEHLVHLARSVIFVYECISVLVYTSVSSYTPVTAEMLILPHFHWDFQWDSVPLCFVPLLNLDWGWSVISQPWLLLVWFHQTSDFHLPWRRKGFNPQLVLICIVCPQNSLFWTLLITQFSDSSYRNSLPACSFILTIISKRSSIQKNTFRAHV